MNDPSPSVTNQPALFHRLRWQLLRNTTLTLLRGSALRIVTIVLLSLIIWGVVFAVGREGFSFLKLHNLSLTGRIVGTLFDLLFLFLFVLLIFSTCIILYSSLFDSAESTFLLSTPGRADQIFAYKFRGAVAFSSWGFLLLGSPLLLAHGLALESPWYFYGLLLLFFLGFVILPGALGAILCLIVVNFLPRHRKQLLIALLALILVGASAWYYRLGPPSFHDPHYPDFVQRLLGQLSFAQGPLAPNHWISRGLLGAARGDVEIAVYCLALVWSNSLFFYVIAAWLAGRLYRRGYNRVATGGMLRRRYGGAWLDRILGRLIAFLDPQTCLLIVKDFRTFRRDPAQWAQVLILMGLILLYFANMRRFYQEELGPRFQNLVSTINLAATALLLCSYTGRFIFPMLSLEGRKFWILGLLPMQRDRLLWGKFAFSATWSLVIAESLIVFSDLTLGMSTTVVGIHALTIAVLAFGLSGLSVGLGAWMPNFRESDPSKIAVGFGGTLNLVAGLLFLIVEIALMAVPWHVRAAYGGDVPLTSVERWVFAGGIAAGMVLGTITALVPLRIGARMLRGVEF